MPALVIREATLSDVESILPLVESYWRHEGLKSFDAARLGLQLREFLANPNYGFGLVALRSGAFVGYLLCAFVYSFEHGGRMAEIDELFVNEECRGGGIGRALLSSTRAVLERRGCVCVQLQVADGNDRAQRLYSDIGFEPKSGFRLWVARLAVDK